MVELNLNVREFADETPSGPIPAGRYQVSVAGSILKDTNSGGKMIVMDYCVDTGEHKGRHLFENLNLWHSNPRVGEIAKRQLANIAKSCGFQDILRRTEDLNGRRLVVQVDVDGSYNIVKKHFAFSEVAASFKPAVAASPVQSDVSSIVPQPVAPAAAPMNLTGQNQQPSFGANPPWC